MIGFYRFYEKPIPVELTVKEKIALLSSVQKTSLLDAFINETPPEHLDYKLMIPIELIRYLFDKIDNIQILSKSYMRGEVIITPAVLDEFGVETTPAVMNIPPTNQTALAVIITPLFDDFTAGQITAILNVMIKWTRYDGSGTWAFYASEIVK